MTSKLPYDELKQRVYNLEREPADLKSSEGIDRLSKQYLEAILNNTNMPVYLKDADYKYIFVNRRFEYLANVSGDQIKGKDDFAIFSEPIAQLFRAQDEKVVKYRGLVEFEETIALSVGVQTFVTAKFPIFNSEGEVDAIGGVCTDITARKKAEAELKEAEEKYRSIFEHSPLGILHLNKDGIVTASNEKLSSIFRLSLEKIIGFDMLKYLKDENLKEAITTVLTGRTSHCEGRYLSTSGNESLSIRCVASPIFASDGSVMGAIGIIEDITERKEAEKALKKAHDELEQRVADRTAELNQRTERLIETNMALKILLEKREEDKQELEQKVLFNVEKLIYPYLEKLKNRCNEDSQRAFLKTIQSNLDDITSSFTQNHNNCLVNLTPAQIQIANLIKQGQTTKEIASLLNLSPATIACHRQEIRKRLLLTHKKINLQAALTTSF